MIVYSVLLAARSPVFATMFYGSLPEKEAAVEIKDVAPDIFRMMLKYDKSSKEIMFQ